MEKETEKNWKKELWQFFLYIVTVVVAAFLIVTFVGQRTEVIGSSMFPTLQDGNQLITDKLSYRFHEPERFDIIVFPFEDDTTSGKVYYIKRIIGMPGETIQISSDGTIYIDGEVLEETYGAEVITYTGTATEPLTLGDDEYYVLGDNRSISKDSRYEEVGTIKRSEITGRAFVRVMPFREFGLITHESGVGNLTAR